MNSEQKFCNSSGIQKTLWVRNRYLVMILLQQTEMQPIYTISNDHPTRYFSWLWF